LNQTVRYAAADIPLAQQPVDRVARIESGNVAPFRYGAPRYVLTLQKKANLILSRRRASRRIPSQKSSLSAVSSRAIISSFAVEKMKQPQSC